MCWSSLERRSVDNWLEKRQKQEWSAFDHTPHKKYQVCARKFWDVDPKSEVDPHRIATNFDAVRALIAVRSVPQSCCWFPTAQMTKIMIDTWAVGGESKYKSLGMIRLYSRPFFSFQASFDSEIGFSLLIVLSITSCRRVTTAKRCVLSLLLMCFLGILNNFHAVSRKVVATYQEKNGKGGMRKIEGPVSKDHWHWKTQTSWRGKHIVHRRNIQSIKPLLWSNSCRHTHLATGMFEIRMLMKKVAWAKQF
jgi:hypothetical protein